MSAGHINGVLREETTHGQPVWITRPDKSEVSTLTAIRTASAVLLAKYSYCDEVVFDGTVAWSGLLPAPGAGHVNNLTEPATITVDGEAQLTQLVGRVERHASAMLSLNQAAFQSIYVASPLSVPVEMRVTVIVHHAETTDDDIFRSVADALPSETCSLIVECAPEVDESLLSVRIQGHAFPEEHLQRMMRSFEHVLHNVLASSKTSKVRDLMSVTNEDMQTIWKWNRAPLQIVDACVHHLIEQRIREHPDAVAVCAWDGQLTYAELDHLSSRLARHLVAGGGVGPDQFVPLCFEKSMWTVVAMMAVLKAGGAFVPLDPAHPPSRLKHIVGQVGAHLILASAQHFDKCSDTGNDVWIVNRRTVEEMQDQRPFSSASVGRSSAAYAIFTSGSTGKPKGVVIEHSQVSTNSICGGRVMGFESRPRMFQFSSYTFDACIVEIITTLVHGGCVCVPSEWQRMNDITHVMNEMEVTCALFTPSLLSGLSPHDLPYLDSLIVGGEKIPAHVIEEWRTRVRLVIAYGPTECCVVCSTLDTSQAEAGAGDIGYAVGGRSWIVDQDDPNKLAPIGSVGELLVEGPILARGYINDQDKTAAAFVQNPTWMPSPARLYKTGDLVRYKIDGSITFVSRKDTQVKLRGQRLELGEVEQQLRRCLSPIQVDVVAEVFEPAGRTGAPMLAAFVCLTSATTSHPNISQPGRPSPPSRLGSAFDVASRPSILPRAGSSLTVGHRPGAPMRTTSSSIMGSRLGQLSPTRTSPSQQTRPGPPRRFVSSPNTGQLPSTMSHRDSRVDLRNRPGAPLRLASSLNVEPRPSVLARSNSSFNSAARRPMLPSRLNSTLSIASDSTSTTRSASAFSASSGVSSRTGSLDDVDIFDSFGSSPELLAKSLHEVKEKLSQLLPGYMVPSVFIPLPSMPLTVAGKTDRRQLRELAANMSPEELGMPRGTKGVHRPLNEVERHMQTIWAQELRIGVEAVGLDDNFFQLGGDSITAMRLVGAARRSGFSISVDSIFRHPKLSELAEIAIKNKADIEDDDINSISPFSLLPPNTKDRLLGEVVRQCDIDISLIEDIYPCTSLQEGLMALSIKEVGTYVMRFVYALPAALDVERFKAAWQTVALQHPILRTRFIQTSSLALAQVVLQENIVWWPSDKSALDSASPQHAMTEMGMGQPMARYTLTESPLSDGYHFVWDVHHAVLDGWSLPQIIRRVEQAYKGIAVSVGVAFNRFIKHTLEIDDKASEAFWRAQLVDAPPPSFPALPSSTYRPQTSASLELKTSVSRARGSEFTIATVARAAWSLLVARYSDAHDVVFGVTLNGRNAPVAGVEGVIGPTIITVPLRVRFDPGQLIGDYLRHIQAQSVEMMPFEHFGLTRIKQMGGDNQAGCAFQNLLIVQPATTTTDTREGPPLFQLSDGSVAESLDYALVMECVLDSEEVILRCRYDANVIDVLQVERLLQQFEHVLQQLVLEPETSRVRDVQIISPSDVAEIFHWNRTTPEPHYGCLQDMILWREQKQPDSAAVCASDGELTYRQLCTLSTRLAFNLQGLGVASEVYVPLCFEKSVWAIIAMLAVLMAGGVCVPLDPCHPPKRRQTIMETVGARVVLCSPAHAPLFRSGSQQTVTVDPRLFKELPTAVAVSNCTASPEDAAYVIFTSGSTGQPKGIVIEHQALCTSVRDHGALMKLDSHSRVLQFAAFTFDISFSDIFATLVYGGCVCLPSEHDRMNDLEGAIRSLNVNQACLTTTVASQLRPAEVSNLKILTIAGEAPTQEILDLWADRVCLMNMYGPAECTIYCAGRTDVRKNDCPGNVGGGVGALLWITDAQNHDRLAPVGAVGELLVEGPILARSYLHDEAKTNAAFVEDPVWIPSKQPGRSRRLYKTGDLVRYGSDGSVLYMGRKDTQVKVRGQRVELGEIEHQIHRFTSPLLELAVDVVTPADGRGKQMIAAFICLDADTDLGEEGSVIMTTPAACQRLSTLVQGFETRLRQVLPQYMIPSLYLPLSRLPISTSAKTDRTRLRQLASKLTTRQLSGFHTGSAKQRLPSTKTENLLRDLWRQVLKSSSDETIAAEDDFFRLGGDSITAMGLVAIARDAGFVLTVNDIFKNSTLAGMAEAVKQMQAPPIETIAPFTLLGDQSVNVGHLVAEVAALCKSPQADIDDIYPTTPTQVSTLKWDLQWPLAGKYPGGYAIQVVFSLHHELDIDKFCFAWETAVSRNPVLRTRLVKVSSGTFQVVINSPILWQKERNLDIFLERDQKDIMGYADPLFRYCIVEEEDSNKRFFVWSAHHSAYDGWSLPLMFAEVEAAFHQRPYDATALKFNKFVQHMMKVEPDTSDQFWRTHFLGTRAKPFYFWPQPGDCLAEETASRMITFSKLQQSNITISTLIHLTWSLIHAAYTQTGDVVLRLVRTGRDWPVTGIEKMIGPAFTHVPFRVRLDYGQKTGKFLQEMQHGLAATSSYQAAGMQRIRGLEEEMRAACDDATLLVVQPTPASALFKPPPGCEFVAGHPFTQSACPLVIEFYIGADNLEVEARYDERLFYAAGMETVLVQFESVFRQLFTAGPEHTLGDVLVPGGINIEELSRDWRCSTRE